MQQLCNQALYPKSIIQWIVFDKTGTITEEGLNVMGCEVVK